jgi:ADP-ribosylglycohydrolase
VSRLPRDRIRGSLLGGAVGDALGAPIEFDSLAEIRARFGAEGLLEPAPAFGRLGAITDDTQMTSSSAEGLILAAGDPPSAARACARCTASALAAHPGRALGTDLDRTDEGWLSRASRRSTAAAIPAIPASPPCAHDGAAPRSLSTRASGCGGLMRIAPAGLARIGDPLRRSEIAAITHGHPTAFLAAGFQALNPRRGGTPLRSACQEALEELRRHPGHEECAAAVERAVSLSVERHGQASPEDVESLGQGWVAEEALAIALFSALAAPDFESALRLAVNHGGDSDSTGAVAGNLLGASLGEAAIPARWLATLELRRRDPRARGAARGRGPKPAAKIKN